MWAVSVVVTRGREISKSRVRFSDSPHLKSKDLYIPFT